jgi:hypothetical protein
MKEISMKNNEPIIAASMLQKQMDLFAGWPKEGSWLKWKGNHISKKRPQIIIVGE